MRIGESSPGFCIWFTGLSGAGKTTTADLLAHELEARGRRVTTLDGDRVREHLSKRLSFTREDRDINVLRVGYVASQIVYHKGITVCSLVSPYRDTREKTRKLFVPGKFLEVYVATSLEECESRDIKGHYGRAREGLLTGFTGIDDPYEPPLMPEVTLETEGISVEANVENLLDDIVRRGFISMAKAAVQPSTANPIIIQ